MWYEATVLKHMWNSYKKNVKLWILWVYTTHIKGRKSWEVEVKHASWIVEKILKAVQWLEEGLQVLEIMEAEEFNIK